MSDAQTSPDISLQEIEVLPNQIQTSPRFNVRPFSSEFSTEIEDKLIEQMAESIEKVGQLDAILITPDKILIAGHRRRRAVLIINERRSARGASLFRLRCAIDRSGGDLRQKSIISNLHRRDTSPMDLAYLITQIRKEFSWQGWAGAKQVANYLNVDQATVVQHERLLCAEKDLQNKVHMRIISAQSAFDLLKGIDTPEARQKTIERASEIQAENQLDKAIESYNAGRKDRAQTTKAIALAPKTRIEHPAIIKAIRERHITTVTHKVKITLTRAELIASILQFDNDAYPEQLRAFAHYWAQTYAQGLGSPEDLRNKFLAIVQQPEPIRKTVRIAESLVS